MKTYEFSHPIWNGNVGHVIVLARDEYEARNIALAETRRVISDKMESWQIRLIGTTEDPGVVAWIC